MKFRFHDDALAEAEQAAEWYSRQKPGLGDEFSNALDRSVRDILSDPTRLPRLETAPKTIDVRRILMDRFPYKVIFEIVGDEVVILAVAHGSRRPNYWIKRRSPSE